MTVSGVAVPLLVSALLRLWGFRLGLWLVPFDRLRHYAIRRPARHDWKRRTAEELCRAVECSSRFTPRSTCLVRAMAAQSLLTENGLNAEIRYGVARRGTGGLEAHAWVVVEEEIVLGRLHNMERFTELPQLGHFGVKSDWARD